MIPIVELIRLEEGAEGTFGVLRIQKKVFCNTLEPQDLENKAHSSSIPAQQYTCKRVVSSTYGETFEITYVPYRSFVLFHPGNRVIDTAGCVLLGQYIGKLRGDRAVLNSGKTFVEFMKMLKGHNEFHLTIKEAY